MITDSPVGRTLTSAGFVPVHTGGGLEAWQKGDDRRHAWISFDNTLGTDLPSPDTAEWLVGVYEGDDFQEAEVIGLAAAIDWCNDALRSSMRWFFGLDGDGTVHLQARLEGDDGRIGDAHQELTAGQDFYGVPYDDLRARRSGVVEVNNDRVGRIADV